MDFLLRTIPQTVAMCCRNDALTAWSNSCKEAQIPGSPNFVFSQALGDAVAIRQWNIWGLPKDDFSTSNAIVLSLSNRWPLCIDPQGQTNKWIRMMHAEDQLTVVKMTGALPVVAPWLRAIDTSTLLKAALQM